MAHLLAFIEADWRNDALLEAFEGLPQLAIASGGTYAETTRIIDGRTSGFRKLVIDRSTRRLLGCHIVGERVVEVAQMAAIAMTAEVTVDAVVRIPLSFPTYANVFGRAALRAVPNRHGWTTPNSNALNVDQPTRRTAA